MTNQEAKAEAEKIIEMFSDNGLRNWSASKQCAIIHVKGMIEEYTGFPEDKTSREIKRYIYWQSILTELEKK